MKNTRDNIVKAISRKTGTSEEETNRVITEFVRILKDSAADQCVTVVPGFGYVTLVPAPENYPESKAKSYKIPPAKQWYVADNQDPELSALKPALNVAPSDYGSSRQHIIDELKTNKKSNAILERFMKISGMPNKVLAEQVFEISPKTLFSYRNSAKVLPVRMNEHILKLEELFRKGIELFETSANFRQWLKSPSYGLGVVKPISLINSITGIEIVMEELFRIEYGSTA